MTKTIKVATGGAGCLLGDGRPCLFDEPDDSPMWQWVREQRWIEEENL